MILGPTEHRIARYLADLCKAGRITLRTADLIAATHVERSEAYRITRRLRTLGLFGIENDQGGNHRGRRIWRTSIEHDASQLDATRHRDAWARIVAWARARRDRLEVRLARIRGNHTSATVDPARDNVAPTSNGWHARSPFDVAAPADPPASPDPGGSALDRLVAAGLTPRLAALFGGGVQ